MYAEEYEEAWQYGVRLLEDTGLNAEGRPVIRRLTNQGTCCICKLEGLLVRHLGPEPDTCPECRAAAGNLDGGGQSSNGKHAFLEHGRGESMLPRGEADDDQGAVK